MKTPSIVALAEHRKYKDYRCRRFASPIDPNEHAFKYYWWVFSQASTCDG
nr:hypothetical protein [Pseudomonas luteola]